MNDIRRKHNMIAMEALQVGLPVNLGSPTFLKVKGIARAIAGWAQDKVRPELRIIPVTYNKIKPDLERANFMDLASVKISVPRGLKGHLNAYTEGLFESFLLVENVNQDVLLPFLTWLSLRLSSPGSLSDISAIKDLKNFKEVDTSKAAAILSGFVDPTSRRETLPMGEVYPSISVMKTSWDNVNALATRYLESNPSKILKTVNDIAVKIDRLIKAIEELPEDQAKLSAQSATILSGICATMAEAVDLYGNIGVLVREVSVCASRHVTELAPAAKTSGGRKGIDMAMESLDLGEDCTLTFDGFKVDYDQLIRIIDMNQTPDERLPISEFDWVVEEGLVDAIADADMSIWENQVVYAVKLEDCYYPVGNLNVIGLAAAAGHDSVRAMVIQHDDLVAQLSANAQVGM